MQEIRGNILQKKITDCFIFYKPNFNDYKQVFDRKDQLIYIEKKINNIRSSYIPCMFYRNTNSKNFLLCFHGNSEDIFSIDNFALNFRSYLNMNVLFIEYPGYSIYLGEQSESVKIFDDSLFIYEWVKKKFKILDNQIYVFGRSLGTSPAIFLCSEKRPKALFLVSAFKSMKEIGADKYVPFLMEEIFNSIKYITKVKCPILLIHGEKDNLISYKHSEDLRNEVLKYDKSHIVNIILIKNMTHNDYNIRDDIIKNIETFCQKEDLISKENEIFEIDKNEINELYKIPPSIFRFAESKAFNIKEFSLSKQFERIKNSHFLIRLFDERIALIHDSIITIYNDKYYNIDFEFDVNEGTSKKGKITSLCNWKENYIICSTRCGDVYIYKIDDEEYKKQNTNICLNEPIYKIEILSSNQICILSEKSIKIYDENLKEIYTFENSKKFFNFVEIESSLIFLSNNGIYYYKIIENKMSLLNNINMELCTQENIYNLQKSYTSLIIGDKNTIYFLDPEKGEIYQEEKISHYYCFDENITYIHKIHDELFLASTDKGNIMQIIIDKDNKHFDKIKKGFTNEKITAVLYKNLRTIFIISEDKIHIYKNNS